MQCYIVKNIHTPYYHPNTFIFFFFLPPSSPPLFFFPFCQSRQLPIRSSRLSSHALSDSRFRFRSSISSSSLRRSRPSSCIRALVCRRRRASSSRSTCTVFCLHSFLNSGVFSSGESTVHLCSRIKSRRASAMHSSRYVRDFSSSNAVCAFLRRSKASGAAGFLVLSGWMRRDFLRYWSLMSGSGTPGWRSRTA